MRARAYMSADNFANAKEPPTVLQANLCTASRNKTLLVTNHAGTTTFIFAKNFIDVFDAIGRA